LVDGETSEASVLVLVEVVVVLAVLAGRRIPVAHEAVLDFAASDNASLEAETVRHRDPPHASLRLRAWCRLEVRRVHTGAADSEVLRAVEAERVVADHEVSCRVRPFPRQHRADRLADSRDEREAGGALFAAPEVSGACGAGWRSAAGFVEHGSEVSAEACRGRDCGVEAAAEVAEVVRVAAVALGAVFEAAETARRTGLERVAGAVLAEGLGQGVETLVALDDRGVAVAFGFCPEAGLAPVAPAEVLRAVETAVQQTGCELLGGRVEAESGRRRVCLVALARLQVQVVAVDAGPAGRVRVEAVRAEGVGAGPQQPGLVVESEAFLQVEQHVDFLPRQAVLPVELGRTQHAEVASVSAGCAESGQLLAGLAARVAAAELEALQLGRSFVSGEAGTGQLGRAEAGEGGVRVSEEVEAAFAERAGGVRAAAVLAVRRGAGQHCFGGPRVALVDALLGVFEFWEGEAGEASAGQRFGEVARGALEALLEVSEAGAAARVCAGVQEVAQRQLCGGVELQAEAEDGGGVELGDAGLQEFVEAGPALVALGVVGIADLAAFETGPDLACASDDESVAGGEERAGREAAEEAGVCPARTAGRSCCFSSSPDRARLRSRPALVWRRFSRRASPRPGLGSGGLAGCGPARLAASGRRAWPGR